MTRVQVHLRAEKLDNLASGRWRGRKSNPYAAVSQGEGSGSASAGGTVQLGETEVIRNNLNPNWTKIFLLDHDESQSWTPLRITVYDSRSGGPDDDGEQPNGKAAQMGNIVTRSLSLHSSNDDQMMGEANVEVGEILGMEGQELTLELEHGGRIYVHITESTPLQARSTGGGERATGTLRCHIRGLDLKNVEMGLLGLGAIDPYFELSKKYADPASGITQWICVYRSEHILNIINPYWRAFEVELEKLCHGDLRGELKIDVWDSEGRKQDRWLGECNATAEQLMESVTKGGNASREGALKITGEKGEEIGLIVVLKADIV